MNHNRFLFVGATWWGMVTGVCVAAAALAAEPPVSAPGGGPGGPPPAEQAAADPYPGVNTVARDRGVWQRLLSEHAKIRRVLKHSEKDGVGIVESLTESDDPEVAAQIKDHALAMQARMKVGATVRVWDPVFRELFEQYANVKLDVTPTDKGVRIVETSADPRTIALMRAHAIGVSAFVRHGHAVAGEETPRLHATDSLPPDEVAIGGLPHRFLLSHPTPPQIDLLRAEGVDRFLNFRPHAEHPAYNESTVATSIGATYGNIPFTDAQDLTDDVLAASRAEYSAAAKQGFTLALHCRTGNRVGPGLAAYLALDRDVPVERAIDAAKAVGMVDPLFESITRDYIRRHLAARSAAGAPPAEPAGSER